MREIIFRAWDDVKKKLVYDFSDYDFRNHTNDGEIFRVICSGEEENGDYYELKLEQYTGLKDKNGKMIFEGDDVRMYDNERLTFQVNFNDRKCGFYVGADQLLASDSQNIEIIGNIHDQKEDV